jgi:hypothetical protein
LATLVYECSSEATSAESTRIAIQSSTALAAAVASQSGVGISRPAVGSPEPARATIATITMATTTASHARGRNAPANSTATPIITPAPVIGPRVHRVPRAGTSITIV